MVAIFDRCSSIDAGKRKKIAHIMLILVDILNLAEQIGIYFIARENDSEESAQQLFFFIIFAVGGASVFKSLFVHPVLMVLFGIAIEVGELVAYLNLLANTPSLLGVIISFSAVEIVLHIISIIGLWEEDKDYLKEFAKECCTLPIRIILYAAIFETQILFLFLDTSSPFRGVYYEILMILATFFGVAGIEKAAKKQCGMKEENNERSLLSIWEGILSLLLTIESPIILITAVVYASQLLQNSSSLKTYDFAIYIIVIILYGSVLLTVAIALLCCLLLCAGFFIKFVTKLFNS